MGASVQQGWKFSQMANKECGIIGVRRKGFVGWSGEKQPRKLWLESWKTIIGSRGGGGGGTSQENGTPFREASGKWQGRGESPYWDHKGLGLLNRRSNHKKGVQTNTRCLAQAKLDECIGGRQQQGKGVFTSHETRGSHQTRRGEKRNQAFPCARSVGGTPSDWKKRRKIQLGGQQLNQGKTP